MISKFRMQAFVKEFPFLKAILDGKSVESISVKRMTPELLRSVPSYSEVCGNSTSYFGGDESIHLIYPTDVANAGTGKELPANWFTYNGTDNNHERWHNTGRPVIEAMDGREQFIVWVTNEYNNYGHYQAGREVVVYKAPKDIDVMGIILDAKIAAESAVDAECNF